MTILYYYTVILIVSTFIPALRLNVCWDLNKAIMSSLKTITLISLCKQEWLPLQLYIQPVSK